MGVAVLFTDALEYASDVTDAESDGEYVCTPRALGARVGPRNSKRTYGVFLDNGVVPERRLRSRIDEQLVLLRALIPNSCTVSTSSYYQF